MSYPHTIHLHGPWHCRDHTGKTSPRLLPGVEKQTTCDAVDWVRTFQWVKPVEPTERVDLVLDQPAAETKVILNDHVLGITDSPWKTFRYEIGALLLARNELILHYESERVTPWVGVAGRVALVVESSLVRVTKERWSFNEPAEASALQIDFEVESTRATPGVWSVELDGLLHQQEEIPLRIGRNPLKISLGPLDIDPWRPRSQGLPIRHRVTFRLDVEGKTCGQSDRLVGLRQADHVLRDQRTVVRDDQVRVIRGLDECWNMDWSVLLRDEKIIRADLMGCRASDSVYDWADRAGILMVHHPGGDDGLIESLLSASHHPSVVVLGSS